MDYILVYNEEKNPPDNTEGGDKNHINDSESRCDIARILSEKGVKNLFALDSISLKDIASKMYIHILKMNSTRNL